MRRILVTGANKGIGKAIVAAILTQQQDVFVFLGSRSKSRGDAARGELLQQHPDWQDRLAVLEIDVASDESVAGAAKQVAAACAGESQPLYAIVNNAGIGTGSADLEGILNVNTRGVRRVCQAFLPLLDSSRGRIVNQTSASGPSFVSACSSARQRLFLDKNVTWDTLDSFMKECVAVQGGPGAFAAKGLGDGNAYGLSKACANSYTVLLARENPHLRVNACTPGFIETDMTRPYAESQGKSPAAMGMKAPEHGTAAALFLLFGEPAGNGNYYGSDTQRSPLDRYRSPGDPPYAGD